VRTHEVSPDCVAISVRTAICCDLVLTVASADSKFRIALFHPCLMAGGIQRVFVNLARGFVERGLAVDLVQATRDDGFRHAVPEGVRLIDLNAGRALTSLLPLVRYLRRERPQVVISGAIQTNLVAVWARRLAGVQLQLILTEHNIISVITADAPMLRTRTTPFFVRRFYPWADELVAVSQGAARDLSRTMAEHNCKIHVIYNPIIGPEFWQRATEPLNDSRIEADARPMVLAVGRLHYHKDYPTLLRAFAILHRSIDARLVFLGGGEERRALETLTQELGLETSVSFLGNVVNPLPYMKRAKVLALSSVVEALPTVLIEALAMNLPIVATDCPTGPREILCDGVYGTLVPVGESERMAEALLDVLRAPGAPVITEEALDRFQHDRVVAQYLAIMGVGSAPRGRHAEGGPTLRP
jgi:glycosyltransferase involved in cell wall biosynthesis